MSEKEYYKLRDQEWEFKQVLKGLIDNLKELLEIYDQTKDSYDFVEGVREIVEDYE